MRITVRLVLCFAAAAAFAALPVYAQHGGGHAGGPGASMGSSHSSTHATHGSSKTNSTKISDQLADNTHLSNKLLSFFPAGTTLAQLQQAAQGFRNLGQFVAAVHVSHNLGISFDQLKATMIGPPKKSLGQAIHTLKPTANAKAETKKGQKQANQDINDSKAS